MSPRQTVLQFFLLVAVTNPLFAIQVAAQTNPVAEKALRHRQRYNLTDLAANSTATNGNITIGDAVSLSNDLSGPSLSLMTIVLPTVMGCVVSLLLIVRLYMLMRKHRGAKRDAFLPRAGLKIQWRGINIAPAAKRAPNGSPLRYSRGSGSTFRMRRGHDTNGAAIEEDGQRARSGDEDDAWEDESRPGAQEEKDDLPDYAIDIDLPGYAHVLRSGAPRANGTVLPGPTATSQPEQNVELPGAEERIASAANYERASRNSVVRAPRPVVLREMTQVHRQSAIQSAAWEHASLR